MDRKKRYSEEPIIGFLREAESGIKVKDLCRQHGFSEASFYAWRSQFGGMEVSDAKRLKALESEKVPITDRQPLARPKSANAVWSMDFIFDRTSSGRQLKILGIVDGATTEVAAAMNVSTSTGCSIYVMPDDSSRPGKRKTTRSDRRKGWAG